MLTAIFVTSACLGLGGFSLSSEASAAGKKGTVNLGQLNRLAAQNSDGMACAYESRLSTSRSQRSVFRDQARPSQLWEETSTPML